MKEYIAVAMRDGSVWGVPVIEVANSRADHYKSEYGDDLQRSLDEDTLPMFESDNYEILDWARNNMNWSDFMGVKKIRDAAPLTKEDFTQAWNDGEAELI